MAAPTSPAAHPPTNGAAMRVLAILLLVVALFLLWPYRGPVVFALVVAFLAHPLYTRLARALPKRWMAASVVLLLVGILLLAPLALLTGLLVREAQGALGSLSATGGTAVFSDLLTRVGVDAARADALVEEGRVRAAAFLQDLAVPALSGTLDILLAAVIFFILLYFALVDGARLVRWLQRLSPLDERPHRRLLEGAGERVKALVWGSLLIALAEGVLAGLGWWLLGMPSPILWGSVMTIMAVIPIVGPFVVLIPGAIYAFATGNIVAGVGLLVLNFVFVGLIDDILRPWLVGRWTRVHPAIILLGILGGIPLMGLSGLILGPLLLSLVAPVMEAWLTPGEGALETPPHEERTPARRGTRSRSG